MNIAVISPDFPPIGVGGCSKSAYLLAQTLRKEHDVDVFVFNRIERVGEFIEAELDRMQIFVSKPQWLLLNNLFVFFSLWSRLKDHDVIHVYNVSTIVAVVLLRLFGRLKRGAQIVMTLNNHHGAVAARIQYFRREQQSGKIKKERLIDTLQNEAVAGGFFGSIVRYFEVQCICWAAKKADWYIALTKQMREDYVTAGYKPDRFVVIPNMVDREFEGGQVDNANKDDTINILFVGQLSPLKGQQEFLQAFFTLSSDVQKRCRVLILGKGKIEAGLKQLASEKSSGEVIIDSVPNKELPDKYAEADILVHLSKYHEPFSRVLLEAMQYRLPILATDHDGAHEILGKTAIYCDPFSEQGIASQLQRLIENEKLRQELADESVNQIKKYAPEIVKEKIKIFYNRIGKGRS
ncbi:glycosyltransferase family 4 protein [Patescibacteria group bacterium]